MDEALFNLSTILSVAALLGQIIGFATEKGKLRNYLVRAILVVFWGGSVFLLFLLLIRYNYCESGCSGRPVNGPTWVIHAVWLALNAAALWFSLKGVASRWKK
jgi:hypothetical protein